MSVKNAFLTIEKLAKGRIQGYEQWQQITLDKDAVLIGRPSDEPDAVSIHVKIIGDDYVSRKPVEIDYSSSDDCYLLRDHGTSNGTFLNGELVETDGRPYRLKDYDAIGLAKVHGEIRVLLRFRTSHKTQPGWVDEMSSRPPRIPVRAVDE
jgi:pSer/pThr/pTyr-binding forkhead associated (FHA) protein